MSNEIMPSDILFIPEPASPKTINFMNDLTKISRKYGIVIDGYTHLIQMNEKGRNNSYSCDDDSIMNFFA